MIHYFEQSFLLHILLWGALVVYRVIRDIRQLRKMETDA